MSLDAPQDGSSLAAAGVHSSEELVKALKAPSDPPPGLKLPKIELAILAVDGKDSIAVPDRHSLLAGWMLDVLGQASKKSTIASLDVRYWTTLDRIVTTRSFDADAIKRLASQHSIVSILTAFAQRGGGSGEALASCARAMRRLFASSAMKTATNNIDQLNSCVDACLAALPQWVQADEAAATALFTEVFSCWKMACVHASNIKKTSKYFTDKMYTTWCQAVYSCGQVQSRRVLRNIVLGFGTVALLTEDTLRAVHRTAAEIMGLSEVSKDTSSTLSALGACIDAAILKSGGSHLEGALQVLPDLLTELVARANGGWPALAQDSIVASIASPLQEQLYMASLHCSVRRMFLKPTFDSLRALSSPTAPDSKARLAASTRTALLSKIAELNMHSTAGGNDEEWRLLLSAVFEDVVGDVRIAPVDGYTSLDLLWQLDATAMESKAGPLLSLTARHVPSSSNPEELQAIRVLIQRITEHFSRTRELPRFCTLLCDAAEQAALTEAHTASTSKLVGALWSEGCVHDWGRQLRGFLAPSQVDVIVGALATRSQPHCSAVSSPLDADKAQDINESSAKRRRTSKGTSARSRAAAMEAPWAQAASFFSASSLIIRNLPAPDASAPALAQTLSRWVEDVLRPAATEAVRVCSARPKMQAGLALATAAVLGLMTCVTSLYNALERTSTKTSDMISPFTNYQVKPNALSTGGELLLALLQARLQDANKALAEGASKQSAKQDGFQQLLLESLNPSTYPNLVNATSRMLLSRWVPVLQVLLDFEALDLVANGIMAVASTDPVTLRLLAADARLIESSTFTAAVIRAALGRLEKMRSLDAANRIVGLSYLQRLDMTTLPASVRANILKDVAAADRMLASAAILSESDYALLARMRQLIGQLCRHDLTIESTQEVAAWLRELTLPNCKSWPDSLHGATMMAGVAVATYLARHASGSHQHLDVVSAAIARSARHGLYSERLARNMLLALQVAGIKDLGSKIDVPDAIVETSADVLKRANLSDDASLLSVLDSLQRLRLQRAIRDQERGAQDERDLSYGEAVIRSLATSSVKARSHIVAAVAFETLRLGWAASSSALVSNAPRLARWAATLLSLTSLKEHAPALRAEIAVRVRESLALDGYESSLAALESYLDEALLAPGEYDADASAVLHTLTLFLCNGPEASGRTSRACFGRVVAAFATQPSSDLQRLPARIAVALVDMLESVARQKAVLLRLSETTAIIQLCSALVAPSSDDFIGPATNVSVQLYKGIVATLTALVRQRPDILAGLMPSLTAVLSQLVTLLRQAPPDYGSTLKAAAHAGCAPAWLDFSKGSLGAPEADLLSRLLLSMTAKTAALPAATLALARKKRRGGDADGGLGALTSSTTTTTSLARPFAKHAIHVLVSYARTLTSPLLTTPPEVRKALQPGLFALCDVVKKHDRDAAMALSLDAAEQVVIKDLWTKWEMQRYRGE